LSSRITMARRPLDQMTEPPDHGARRAQRGATTAVRAEEFSPLVREWVAFLAERLAEEALRDHEVDRSA
jgi:hypothetical protein